MKTKKLNLFNRLMIWLSLASKEDPNWWSINKANDIKEVRIVSLEWHKREEATIYQLVVGPIHIAWKVL